MSSFLGSVQALIATIGPYFLHNKNLGTFLESIALTYDDGLESLKQGIYLSNPIVCDSSALPVLSVDRGIRLYPTESDASKRLRLSRWLQLHRVRGTHGGELKHAQPYFLPDVPVIRIVHQDGAGDSATWHTIGIDGVYTVHRAIPSNWDYDGHQEKWSRFWVIIYIPARYVGMSEWDDGSTWDSDEVWDGISADVALDIVSLLLEWHSGHSRIAGIILATDPASFDPTGVAVTDADGWTSLPIGNWGSPVSSPPVSVRTRPPLAIWLYENNP